VAKANARGLLDEQKIGSFGPRIFVREEWFICWDIAVTSRMVRSRDRAALWK